MTAPRILSPEEFRALQQGDDPKPKVTVGPLQPVGIPADEMARIASGEMGLGNAIAARLQLAHEPDAEANAVLEDVNRRTAPGALSTAANIALSNAAAPFSEKMAAAGTEGALARFTTGGGDASANANLFGLAAAGGAVGGNAALAAATPPVPIAKGAGALKSIGIRAAEGAAQNAGVSLAGSTMDGDSLGDAAQKALVNAGAGAVFGAGIEGAGRLGGVVDALRPKRTPDPAPAEQVRAEILAKLDPRDRAFAMNDPQFGRAFNPEGRRHVMSPEEFAQARAARESEQAADVARLREGVADAQGQGREVRFPTERTAAAKNAEPMLNLKNRAGKMDFSPSQTANLPDGPLQGTKVVDERGNPQRVFHGSAAAFDTFDTAKMDPNALYGPGLYFTENPVIAGGDGGPVAGYANKGLGPFSKDDLRARIAQRAERLKDPANSPEAVRKLTNQQRLDEEALNAADNFGPNVRPARLAIKRPFDINGDAEDAVESVLSAAQQKFPDHDWDYAMEVLERRMEEVNLSGHDLYQVLSRTIDENGKPLGKAAANEILRGAGYDGITHIGGLGKENPHRVWIAFDRSQVRSAFDDPRFARQTGSVAPEVGQALASAGVGAAVGASQDKEDRLRGAMLGGATGLAAFAGMKRGGSLGLSTEDVSQNPKFPRTEPQGTPYRAPIDNGADPRLFNLKKYGFSDEGEQIFREIVGELDLKKKRVGWDETMAEAHRRSTDPDALIRLNGQWDGTDGLAARLFVAQSTHRIGLLSKELARTNGVPADAADAMRAEIARLTDDIGIMAGRAAKERSAAGRNLNAYRIIARNAMDTPTWQQLAFRANGGVPLDSDQILRINELTRTNNREGLVQFVAGLHKSSISEKLITLWKAGLLTNPVTQVVNNAGNASMAAMETAKEPIAMAADHIIALIRGTERTKAASVKGLVQDPILAGGASLKAAVQAVRQQGVLGALRSNMTEEMIGKWDFRQVNFDSPVLQAYTDVVFGSLSAEDRLWRNMAFARSMEEQVRLHAPKVAKAEGISVREAQARLRQTPPEELKLKAIGDAEIAVFQNKNALAEGMKGLKAGVRKAAGPKGEAVVDFVAPFVRTPTNVALRLMDYTPVGAIKLWKVLKPELSGAEQKQVAEQVGRVALGSGLVWLGFTLAANGKATGAAPKDAAARGQYDLEGKQANSVRIGDSWVNISRISPAGMLVAVGAQMYEIAKEAKSPEGAVAGALYAPARVALDQSFLKGVSGVLDAANDPTRYGERFVEQTAGSIVPAGIAAIARATDKTVRSPEGIGQTVAARIPGLSRTVPARRDPFGQPMERVASAPEQMVSPLPRSRAKDDDPVVAELSRLGVEIGMPSRTQASGRGRNKTREKLEQPDYEALVGDAGSKMRDAAARIINSPNYATWSDELKATMLDRVISRARTQAYALQRARRDGRRVAGEESAP